MINHEHGQPPMDNAASSNSSPESGALVTQTANGPLQVSMPGGMSAPMQEVLRGGMDANSMFHSFRRRWLLALCMGLVAGALIAALLYWLFPESSSAVAMFQVDAQQQSVMDPDLAGTNTSFDTYRRTQIVLIKSPFVLNTAMNEVGRLSVFDGIEDSKRVEWLADELEVRFPQDSEVLEIKLTGSAPTEELEQVVEAVSKVYENEIVFDQQKARQRPLEILKRSSYELQKQIRRETETYYNTLKDAGSPLAVENGVDAETKILLSEITQLSKQITESNIALQEQEVYYQILKKQLQDPDMLEKRIDEYLSQDPTLASFQQQMSGYDYQIQQYQGMYKNGRSKKVETLQRQKAAVAQQMQQYRAQMKASLSNQSSGDPDPALKQATQEYQIRKNMISQRMGSAKKRMDEIQEILREKGEVDVDLALRKANIDQLTLVANSIAQRIQKWEVETEAPRRVQRIPGIEKTPYINKAQRYIISGLGGLTTFALTCFGIAYMEFRNRKLNGPEQLDEGLGIRVIGTLPALSGRKAMDPRNPVVAQLTESIDSVRTALMHESTTRQRKVVLVTSASAMEGRTTVASQLAASLARAGRRTLLVDGDLRRPALHSIFNVPLEDGLSEVLRAEADVADAVRATPSEGLWLMTAGFCDADAVHALATDQAQPIFDKLRGEYDFVIIDGAPVIGLSDSLLFGQHCDGAILSVLRDYTCVPKIHQSAELLKGVGIRLIGAVVNGVPIKTDRRVTHLQVTGSKSQRKQIEQVEVEA